MQSGATGSQLNRIILRRMRDAPHLEPCHLSNEVKTMLKYQWRSFGILGWIIAAATVLIVPEIAVPQQCQCGAEPGLNCTCNCKMILCDGIIGEDCTWTDAPSCMICGDPPFNTILPAVNGGSATQMCSETTTRTNAYSATCNVICTSCGSECNEATGCDNKVILGVLDINVCVTPPGE
jgi:hypothetical protein